MANMSFNIAHDNLLHAGGHGHGHSIMPTVPSDRYRYRYRYRCAYTPAVRRSKRGPWAGVSLDLE